MSYVSTFNAFQVSGISKAEQHVLTAICTFADKNGVCWPTTETIAARCLSSVRTVQKHINGLVSKGLIQRIYRKGRPATTKVLVPQTLTPTPATSAPPPPQLLRGEPVIEPVNTKTAVPATEKPDTASPVVFFDQSIKQPDTAQPPEWAVTESREERLLNAAVQAMEIALEKTARLDIPEQPADPASQKSNEVFATDCTATRQIIEQPANITTEAPKTPVTPSNEADPANPPTDTPTPAVEHQAEVPATQDQAIEADPVEAEWAKVDPQVLRDLESIRREKRKKPTPTKTEIKHWYSIALAEGWTLPQLAYALVLKNWSRVEPGWLQHVPRPQMTATGTPSTPAAPKLWEPTPHTPASTEVVTAAKAKLAELRAQILADSARRREEQIARLRQ